MFCPSPWESTFRAWCGLSLLWFLPGQKSENHRGQASLCSWLCPPHPEHSHAVDVCQRQFQFVPQKSPLPPISFLLCFKGLSPILPKLITEAPASFPISPSAMLWCSSSMPCLACPFSFYSALQHIENGPAISEFEGIGQEVGGSQVVLSGLKESTCLSLSFPIMPGTVCLGCNLQNDRTSSVCFHGKPFNITVIQVYAPTLMPKKLNLNDSMKT